MKVLIFALNFLLLVYSSHAAWARDCADEASEKMRAKYASKPFDQAAKDTLEYVIVLRNDPVHARISDASLRSGSYKTYFPVFNEDLTSFIYDCETKALFSKDPNHYSGGGCKHTAIKKIISNENNYRTAEQKAALMMILKPKVTIPEKIKNSALLSNTYENFNSQIDKEGEEYIQSTMCPQAKTLLAKIRSIQEEAVLKAAMDDLNRLVKETQSNSLLDASIITTAVSLNSLITTISDVKKNLPLIQKKIKLLEISLSGALQTSLERAGVQNTAKTLAQLQYTQRKLVELQAKLTLYTDFINTPLTQVFKSLTLMTRAANFVGYLSTAKLIWDASSLFKSGVSFTTASDLYEDPALFYNSLVGCDSQQLGFICSNYKTDPDGMRSAENNLITALNRTISSGLGQKDFMDESQLSDQSFAKPLESDATRVNSSSFKPLLDVSKIK